MDAKEPETNVSNSNNMDEQLNSIVRKSPQLRRHNSVPELPRSPSPKLPKLNKNHIKDEITAKKKIGSRWAVLQAGVNQTTSSSASQV